MIARMMIQTTMKNLLMILAAVTVREETAKVYVALVEKGGVVTKLGNKMLKLLQMGARFAN